MQSRAFRGWIAAAAILSACGTNERARQHIFATGPTGGTFLPLGGAIAQKWNHNLDDINVTAITTAAGLENLRLLESGEASFALLPESISYFAVTGTDIIENLNESFQSFSMMARIYPEPAQIFARRDSDIRSVRDFEGKKVSLGARGGYQHLLGMHVFELAGLKLDAYSPSYTGYGVAADQFQDGLISGGFFLTGVPNATLSRLAFNPGVRLIPIGNDVIRTLRNELPFVNETVIPATAYASLEEPTPTFSIWTLLLVRKDIPVDIVYRLTQVLFETAGEVAETNAQAKWIDVTNGKNASIPVHPGAQRYYNELKR